MATRRRQTEDCGCGVVFEGDTTRVGYCGVHSAAMELFEALNMLYDSLGKPLRADQEQRIEDLLTRVDQQLRPK